MKWPVIFGKCYSNFPLHDYTLRQLIKLFGWKISETSWGRDEAVFSCRQSLIGFKYQIKATISEKDLKITFDPSVQIQAAIMIFSGIVILGGFSKAALLMGIFIPMIFLAGELFYIHISIKKAIDAVIEKRKTEDNIFLSDSNDLCPACGFRLSDFVKICPECGLHFHDTRKPGSVTGNTMGYKIRYEYNQCNSKRDGLQSND